MATAKHMVLPKELPDEAHRPARAPGVVRVRRGAYVPRSVWDEARPEQRHRYLVTATVAMMRTKPVLGYESAAVLLGIPLVGPVQPTSRSSNRPRVAVGRADGVIRHGTRTPSHRQLAHPRP